MREVEGPSLDDRLLVVERRSLRYASRSLPRAKPRGSAPVGTTELPYLTGVSFSPGQFEFALSMKAASCLKAGTRSLNWKR
jgi:hypothetical protein